MLFHNRRLLQAQWEKLIARAADTLYEFYRSTAAAEQVRKYPSRFFSTEKLLTVSYNNCQNKTPHKFMGSFFCFRMC